MFNHKIEVRFNDFDSMGHVNNAVFLTYLEIARINFMKHVFQSNETNLHNRKFDFILAHVSIDYKLPIEIQFILAHIWVSKIGNTSFEFSYKITDDKNQTTFATASSVQVSYDYNAKIKVPIPNDFKILLEKELMREI